MTIQATSLISYYSIITELGKRQKEVILAVKRIQPCNNLMVAKYLGLPINSVTPRMNEIRKKGIIVYSKTDKCPYTHKLTRYFIIKKWIQEVMD